MLEKQERNRQFVKAWKSLRLGNRELAGRFDMTIGGVKSLKSRLRKKDPDLYDREDLKLAGQADELIRTQSPRRKISFYLEPTLVVKLKVTAAERRTTASELAGVALRRWMVDEGILSY